MKCRESDRCNEKRRERLENKIKMRSKRKSMDVDNFQFCLS